MPPSFPDDQTLIAGCLRGDKKSWDCFVEKFSKLIYWGIWRILDKSRHAGNKEVCAEVFQEIFARLLEKRELEKVRESAHLSRFLSVMTCHATLDKIKALSRQDARSVSLEESALVSEDKDADVPLSSLMDVSADPSEKAAGNERDLLIGEALKSLSPKERACVEFYYLEEKTHEEIAGLLGLAVNTVSSILRRSKDKLKERFGAAGLGEL